MDSQEKTANEILADEKRASAEEIAEALTNAVAFRTLTFAMDKLPSQLLIKMWDFIEEGDDMFHVSVDEVFESVDREALDFGKQLVAFCQDNVVENYEEFCPSIFGARLARSMLRVRSNEERIMWVNKLIHNHHLMMHRFNLMLSPITATGWDKETKLRRLEEPYTENEQKFIYICAQMMFEKIHRLELLLNDLTDNSLTAREKENRRMLLIPVNDGKQVIYARTAIEFAREFGHLSEETAKTMIAALESPEAFLDILERKMGKQERDSVQQIIDDAIREAVDHIEESKPENSEENDATANNEAE